MTVLPLPNFFTRALLSRLFTGSTLAIISYMAVSVTAQENTDEVVVTAIYDKSVSVQTLAASLDVLDIRDIQNIAATHPAEALNTIAGVNIHRGSGQEHLTSIRSPVLTGGAGAGSFLYLEDGVPLRAAGFANVNGLFEGGTEFAKALDVLKGPGPAQYGSNAVHGLVDIASRPVEGDDVLRLMGSDDGFFSAMASISQGPFRASLSLAHDNGFREESGFDQQKFQLKYSSEIGGWDIDWLSSFNNLNQETAGFIQGEDAYLNEAVRFTNPNPEAFREGRSYRTQAQFRHSLNGHTLSLTPFARHVKLHFLRHFVPGQALEDNEHTSWGLQGAYFGENFNIGADIEYTQGSLFEFQSNPSRFSFVQGLHFDYKVEALVAAAYAQRDIHLGNDTVLDIGARMEYTRYDYDNQAGNGRSGRFIRVADRHDDFFVLTPKLSLRHNLNDKAMLYARLARSARAPQTADLYSVQLNQVAGEADVETLDSLEFGYKADYGAVQTDLALYAQRKDNFFFRNANGFNVTNGKTKHHGIELSISADITPWLTVTADGTWALHQYDFSLNEGSPANNITKGERVDTAPDTLATMRVKITPSSAFSTEIEWRHVGRYFTNPGNTNDYPGHDVFVLRGDYHLSKAIRIFGRVDNVFDTRYADRADFAFGNERFFPGRPRTIFLGFSFSGT